MNKCTVAHLQIMQEGRITVQDLSTLTQVMAAVTNQLGELHHALLNIINKYEKLHYYQFTVIKMHSI